MYFLINTSVDPWEVVTFDAVPESSHRNAAEGTQHPVESGALITDHVRPVPRELSLVCVASNVPAGFLTWAGRSDTHAQDIYEQLTKWLVDGASLLVLAGMDFYENMILLTVERGHDHTKGEAAHLSLSLREMQVVSTETVDAPTPRTARGAKKKPKGQKATTTKPAADNSSVLDSIVGLVRGGG